MREEADPDNHPAIKDLDFTDRELRAAREGHRLLVSRFGAKLQDLAMS